MRVVAVGVGLAVLAACGGSDAPTAGSAAPAPTTAAATLVPSTTVPVARTTSPVPSTPPTTSAATGPGTTQPAVTQPAVTQPAVTGPELVARSAFPLTQELSDDLLAGRDNDTIGSALAREILVAELSSFAEPLPSAESFELPFGDGALAGTNVVAVVPGTDLADEYVVIGAHYDHLGENCRYPTADDVVCNGAADNAAGVAIAIEAARAVAGTEPRRSVVVALWDAEEDGLLGSWSFMTRPPLDVDRVVAYLNLDLLGVSLLPSLDRHTVVIGAESGGAELRELAVESVVDAGLTPVSLSVVFGQGRSDHAPFAEAGVPVVFFSDSTNGCYHTVDDEIDRIDQTKLDRELAAATATLDALARGDITPDRDVDPPTVAFDDVVALHEMVTVGEPDLDLLGAGAGPAQGFLRVLDRLVEDGPSEFDGTDANTVLNGAGLLVEALATQDCPS